MRILIVDDEKNIRLLLSTALEAMRHEVTLASSSATAIEALKKAAFDAVPPAQSGKRTRFTRRNPPTLSTGRCDFGDGLRLHRDRRGSDAAWGI